MNYTKGKWQVEDGTQVICGNHLIANTGGWQDNCQQRAENEANACLIAAAVNACESVNPDNPMAVAESIKDMYEALKAWDEYAGAPHPANLRLKAIAYLATEKALSKVEGK